MKCPNCHYEVADSVLVCPVCFTTIHDNSPNTLIHQSDQPNINNNNAPQVQRVVVKTINTNNEVNKPQVVQVQQVVVKEENDMKVSDLVVDEPVNNGRTEVELIDKKNKKVKLIRRKSDYFFLGVIGIGSLILVIYIISLFSKEDIPLLNNNTTTTTIRIVGSFTENQGHHSSFNYPMKAGNTTLASIYDKDMDKYTDVDVTGIRFISGDEANNVALTHAIEPLNPDFEWLGFEYKVTLNDLDYLGDRLIDPVLIPKIYKWNGCDFANHNGKNYILNVVSIYDGNNIKNKESAIIKVLYQMPIGMKDYSLCFGKYEQTLGCFSC